MTNYTSIIIKYLLGELPPRERELFEMELQYNHQLRLEFELQQQLDHFMRVRLKLEETEHDPNLALVDSLSKNDIAKFLGKLQIKNNQRNNVNIEEDIQLQIQQAEIEIAVNGIENKIVRWVNDWNEQREENNNSRDAREMAPLIEDSFKHKDLPPVQPPERKNKRSTNKIAISIGAVVAFSLILMLMVNIFTPTLSNDKLFEKFYGPLTDNSFQLRSSQQEMNLAFREGLNQYLAAEYSNANQKFDEMLQSGFNSPELLLYSGLTKAAINDYPAAIKSFNNLLDSSDQYSPEAKWYLGLCYLKTGDTQKTREIMEELVQQKFYLKKAQLILKNLEK